MNMRGKIAGRVAEVPPSGIRRFFELVQGVEGVISLGVGEPDFVTPWHIREACIYSLEKGYTMYTSNYGMPELREELSRAISRRYGVDYSPENELLVTVGVSEAFDLAIRALVDPGDEVLIPEPCYVSYVPCTVFAGGKPVSVPTSAEEGFRVSAESIEERITERSKVLVLCYPNNPTGATLRRKELEEIAEVVVEHELVVITDELYDRLTYSGKHVAFPSLNGMKEYCVYLNGFSKSYAMTGWRIGYAAGCAEVIEAMMKIHQYAMLCAPVMSQMAALEALRRGDGAVESMRRAYDRRRRLIVKRLREVGLECFEPEGAFYVFPSVRSTGMSSEEFAERLLREQKVAVVPGNAFGSSGEGHVRMAYATSLESINEAMDRIERFLRR
ncbi:MAG: aminotransferase class I/II-fold pyridoxal phosphate-dependent enzyme [Euryarchaeota archaeon]|nr:aminotransferase class I/II-fold pyridoxal phosphate-dependent enzyme [Euryarchaeota archaeon]